MPVALNISSDAEKLFRKKKTNHSLLLACFKLSLLAVILLSISLSAIAQKHPHQPLLTADSAEKSYDSALNKLFYSIKQFGNEEQKKNIKEYDEDIIATKQEQVMEEIRRLTLEAKSYLENGLDTTGFTKELNNIDRWYDITSEGVFKNTGTIQTNRNLETSFKVMRELLTRMLARKSSLDDYYKNLVDYRNHIDSLYKDSVLYKFSSDSAVLMRYVTKLTVLSQEVKPIDSSFKQTITDVAELQPTVNLLVNKLNASLERITLYQQDLSKKTFTRETTNLGGPVKYSRPYMEIVRFSTLKSTLALAFFARNEIGKIIFMFLLVIAVTFLLGTLRRKLQSQNILNTDLPEQLALKYPFLTSILVVCNVLQFIFLDPPFIFNAILWIITSTSLTIIFRKFVSRYWLVAWLIMFVLFLCACAENTFVLQASRTDRWIMFVLSVAGIIVPSIIILLGHRSELKEKLVVYFIGFVILLQIAALFYNAYGRYNLSKTLLTSGFFSAVLAIIFFWTLRIIVQTLALALKAYRGPGKKLFTLNFDQSKRRVPVFFYVLLFTGWFILFARNFYAFRLVADPIKNFVELKRTMGDFSFTVGGILEFFLILYLAGLTSKVVAFFASDKSLRHETGDERSDVGSWSLIIRISIITIGFLLAFAAVGIPMDKLTIILSALSVGVGFGLQTLVNNLVSGLIISFERPVKVGDMVDIAGESGFIKSIGFRSSIISTAQGSEVVIPNGELLNQHLVNWTHNNNHRSVDIPISVAYGTDLQKAIQILKELPAKDNRILETPAPGVIVKQFNTSSIDMQLSFWVEYIKEAPGVKSDMILAIATTFKENKIEIPFPQQDLHIRSIATDGINRKKEVEEKDSIKTPNN